MPKATSAPVTPAAVPHQASPSSPPPVGVLGAVSFAVSILAMVTTCLPYIGLLAGLVAVVLGVVALVRSAQQGQRIALPVAGLTIGAIALVVAGCWTAFARVVLPSPPTGPELPRMTAGDLD